MKLRNEQYTTLSVTPYEVAVQLATVYQQATTGDTWNAETALQAIAHSTLQFIPNTEGGCIEAMYYLNNKLEAVRKTISFWDAYQITDAIEDSTLILNKLAQLPNNSSLVNNTKNPFIWSNPTVKIDAENHRTTIEKVEEKVYQGDIFIKDYQGTIHLIHATNKGVYVPKTIYIDSDVGNSISIKYEYMSSGNEPPEVTISPAGPTGSGGLKPTLDSGYNIRGTLNPTQRYNFNVLFGPTGSSSFSDIAIVPVVKFFNNNDQVILEECFSGPYDGQGLLVDTTTITGPTGSIYWRIENNTPIELHYEVR